MKDVIVNGVLPEKRECKRIIGTFDICFSLVLVFDRMRGLVVSVTP